MLERALKEGYTNFNHIRGDPDLEFLHADERFEELLDKYDRGF
jgi:hypothetical protein